MRAKATGKGDHKPATKQKTGESRKPNQRGRQTGKTYKNELGLPRRTPCQDRKAKAKAKANP